MEDTRLEKIASEYADEKSVVATEPPRIYFAACGSLCDVFWWARKPAPDLAD